MMIKKVVEEYLNQIQVEKYSIVTINPLDEISIISNQPQAWEQDFIKMKLHLRSNIVLKAKEKITPFWWSAESADNEVCRKLVERYKIHCGVTFVIKIKCEHVIFTLYFNENDQKFFNFYQKEKHRILFEILSLFEKNYKREPIASLTSREKEVLDLLKIGKTYSEIGTILGVTERTVRFHITNVLDKLNVTSVKYAIVKAMVEGII
ncbi:LuxR C-terminal-related transcriptional regulator [Bisgaard Taxon 10/6]|uniref:helix-turn-helix transcriptional regulator n=1 Tax=Exercitatus varius TaxID=67857 RepID=UPI00294AD26F|nr:LuxR C-terminal-related transcriptional regulator [Exercitatus varius]MDG2918316.1 LuxR C-terminal-related transcriptional regulator [Exercitatus varius]MDG2940918.1 LuxR C-terminal-related transcriptional regulator [Exercitatus varius]